MKCYFRENNEWIKGYFHSGPAGRSVRFIALDGTVNWELHSAEILVGDYWMPITGYRRVGAHHELISLDVSPTWIKPQDPKKR